MEIDPPCLENLDQVPMGTDDDQQTPTLVRSYACTFCKRGFSNAQALGGHMNIHRKDRGKLKKTLSTHNKLTLDITKKDLSFPSISSHENKSDFLEYYIDDKACTLKWPWIIPRDEDIIVRSDNYVGELRQLELFVESPSSSEDQKLSSLWEEKMMMQYSSHVSARTDIDLELRLGREPLDRTTTAVFDEEKRMHI